MGPITPLVSSKSKICHVGYALNQKKLRKSKRHKADSPSNKICSSNLKWQGGGLADIIFGFNNDGQPLDDVYFTQFSMDSKINDLASTHQIKNNNLKQTFSKHIESDKHLDVIIHKLTEDLEKTDDQSSVDKLNRLQDYLKLHPTTVIIDPLENVKKVTSRVRSCENISQIKSTLFECSGSICRLTQPNYFVVPDINLIRNTDKFLMTMKQHNITFPIICKPTTACGSVNAHIMSIVLRQSDLSIIQTPCIIQQYYNHNSQLYKVYVIGNDVMVYRRSSLPDLTYNDNVSDHMNSSSAIKEEVVEVTNVLEKITTIENLESESESHNEVVMFGSFSSSSSSSSTSSSSSISETHKENNMISKQLISNSMHCQFCGHILKNNGGLKLKSVIFDSRLTYPSINEFIDGEQSFCHCLHNHHKNDRIHEITNINNNHNNNIFVNDQISETEHSQKLTNHDSVKMSHTRKRRTSSSDKNHSKEITNLSIFQTDEKHINNGLRINTIHNEENSNRKDLIIEEFFEEEKEGSLPLSLDCFKHAAKLMREQFGLSLFGFDVIFTIDDLKLLQKETNQFYCKDDNLCNNHDTNLHHTISVLEKNSSTSSISFSSSSIHQLKKQQSIVSLYVIDVNYFPSYKEVSDFPIRLRRFLKSVSCHS